MFAVGTLLNIAGRLGCVLHEVQVSFGSDID